MKAAKHILVFVLLLMSLLASVEAAGNNANEPKLRIGLEEKQPTVTLSSEQPLIVRNAADQAIIKKYPANAQIVFVWKNNQVYIDSLSVNALQLTIETASPEKKEAFLRVNGKAYRGSIALKVAAGLSVINCISLEEYLYGVIPAEMPDGWPPESLKAQAIAARTFALYSRGKHAAEGFDLCATNHCQVYGGRSAEKAHSSAAVEATRGQVLLYQGKPIYAPFHTTSGGMTENSEDVWGSYLPYLRAVKDSDKTAPDHRWRLQFTPAELQAKLQAAGYAIGKLQSITLSPLSGSGESGKNAADRSAAGHVKTMRFTGDRGSVLFSGSKVRNLLGLKSTCFDLHMIVSPVKKIAVSLGSNSAAKEIAVNLPPYKEAGLYTDAADLRRITGRPGEVIAVEGRGWGHGLGLSQWGAKAMAATSDYAAILHHYYTNVEIKKIY